MPIRMDKAEFLARVRQEFPYEIEGSTEGLVKHVLNALDDYITEGELEDIRSNLPKDLVGILPASKLIL